MFCSYFHFIFHACCVYDLLNKFCFLVSTRECERHRTHIFHCWCFCLIVRQMWAIFTCFHFIELTIDIWMAQMYYWTKKKQMTNTICSSFAFRTKNFPFFSAGDSTRFQHSAAFFIQFNYFSTQIRLIRMGFFPS